MELTTAATTTGSLTTAGVRTAGERMGSGRFQEQGVACPDMEWFQLFENMIRLC